MAAGGKSGPAGAHRDQPRGHRRHGGLGRHPDQPRRDDLPRRGRRARHGQALRRRRRGAASIDERRGTARGRRRAPEEGDELSIDGSTGEVIAGGWIRIPPRSSRCWSTSRCPRSARSSTRGSRQADGWADGSARLGGAHQRRHARRTRRSPGPSAPRASACAAPSTCSSARTASRPCAR